jgi:hypothetical protein
VVFLSKIPGMENPKKRTVQLEMVNCSFWAMEQKAIEDYPVFFSSSIFFDKPAIF